MEAILSPETGGLALYGNLGGCSESPAMAKHMYYFFFLFCIDLPLLSPCRPEFYLSWQNYVNNKLSKIKKIREIYIQILTFLLPFLSYEKFDMYFEFL